MRAVVRPLTSSAEGQQGRPVVRPPSLFRRLAVVLPLLVGAAVLPVATPVSKPRVRHWAMTALNNHAQRAPGDFALVGLSVPNERPEGISVRTSRDGKRWSPWTPLEFEAEVGPDLDSHEKGAHTSMPVWTGTSRYVDVRGAPKGAKVHAIDPGPDPSLPASSAIASPSKPGIITRAQWGADESIRKGGSDYASSLKLAVVHHTATADSYAKSDSDNIMRSIYAYHVNTNGWDDIGYNFLVDRYGQIFEGRYGGVGERSPRTRTLDRRPAPVTPCTARSTGCARTRVPTDYPSSSTHAYLVR
jgi:hypothetical protein